MKSSPSPSGQECSIKDTGYFNPTITAPGRQRTAQACDKCRERKTKCSGEKPVCQRCTNRGLICEYSYREPRVRGPARARITPSIPALPTRDLSSKPYSISVQDVGHSRFLAPRRNHQPLEYSLGSISSVSRHYDSASPYLGAQPKSYSESQALHLPYWADVRRSSNRNHAVSSMGLMGFSSPQLPHISATAREANPSVMMMYDSCSTVRQPTKRQEMLLGSVPNSSSFLLEAQQSPRYNAGDLHYDYRANDHATSECPLSSSPEGSCNSYQSSSTLSTGSSPTPTPPFYPLDYFEHSSMESHGESVPNDYNGDTFTKPGVSAEDGTANLIPDFSYTRNLGMRGDWCVDSDSNKLFSMGGDAGRNDGENNQHSGLWSTNVSQVSQVELDLRLSVHA